MARKKTAEANKTASARDVVLALEAELNRILLEREDEIHSMILALISRQHVFQLGVPGTGKSMLAVETSRRLVGASRYEILFSRFSTPEEVFGPPSLRALREHDRYERNGAGMLQQADVAFLDEVWKANSAILNTLLPILNERVYREGGVSAPVPLQTMVCASNELPQGEDLAAIYDRILFRHLVQPLSDSGLRTLMLNPPDLTARVEVDWQTLQAAQKAARSVRIMESTVDTIMGLRSRLAAVKGVYVSPRRWRACLSAIQAEAFLQGRDETQDSDVLVLAHCLWADPEHRAAVEVAVIDSAAPALRAIRDLLDVAVGLERTFSATDDENERVEAFLKIRKCAEDATEKAASIGDVGERYAEKVRAIYEAALQANRRHTAEVYGVTDLFEEVK